jgi:FkbM family methyltransferase
MQARKPRRRRISEYNFSAPYYQIDVAGKALRYVASSASSHWRIHTLFEKEPTTIAWLDSFQPGEVLIDIGANIGMYSIYAAQVRAAIVYAFEPESQNFAELNRNIYINRLQGKAFAFPMAISDGEEVSLLHLSRFGTGYGEHNFGTASPDWNVAYEQGSVSMSLDSLIASGAVPMPHHIKVDVDGIEWRVFNGMQNTLRSPHLKTVLFETNFKLPKSVAIIEDMMRLGWTYSKDQARINQHEIVPFEEIVRRMRAGTHGQNFIYFRDPFYSRLFADFAAGFVPPNPIRHTMWERMRRPLGRLKRGVERTLLRPFLDRA